MVKPVTTAIIEAARPNVDAEIERINAILSQPWSHSEPTYGRCVAPRVSGAALHEVIRIYSDPEAGWLVEHTSDQRDGDFLRFKRHK